MKLVEALNEMRTWIPFQRKEEESVLDALKIKFSDYIALLKTVNDDDFNELFRENSLYCKSMGKKAFINLISQIQQTIDNAISAYAEGNPSKSYEYIHELLAKNKFIPREKNRNPKYASRKLNEPLGFYFKLDIKGETDNNDCFRMRISKEPLSKEEMFHIPLNMRQCVATQRFSIPGYPCLYLGTSLEVCWDEIRDEIKDKAIYACRFRKKEDKTLVLLNLMIPDEFTGKEDSYSHLCFLLTFPFYLACLIQTKYPKEPFKPEYVIPRLLLQYVNGAYRDCSVRFDGIVYSSTKSIPCVGNKSNWVIPYRPGKKEDKKYSSELLEIFSYTEPVVVQLDKMKEAVEELGKMELSSLPEKE